MSVVTLIPAYKHRYFERTINSVLQQYVKPSRILISDDSPDGLLTRLFSEQLHEVKNRIGLEMEIIPGPRKGPYLNILHLLRNVRESEKLVHFLFDDDVIFPGFYEHHIYSHEVFDRAQVTLSKRTYINEMDSQIRGYGCPEFLTKTNKRFIPLFADFLYKTVVPITHNWLGEFSNSVFKRDIILELIDLKFSGVSYFGLGDLGAFLQASEKPGGILLINDYLGSFRMAPGSSTTNRNSFEFQASIIAWIIISLHAQNSGFISNDEFSQCCTRVKSKLESRGTNETAAFLEILGRLVRREVGSKELFLSKWECFLRANFRDS